MSMSWVWTIWLGLIVLTFAVLEAYALHTNQTTLSRFIWDLTAAWPPFPWIAGFITGFLVCHFWWGGIVTFSPVIKTVGGWFGH